MENTTMEEFGPQAMLKLIFGASALWAANAILTIGAVHLGAGGIMAIIDNNWLHPLELLVFAEAGVSLAVIGSALLALSDFLYWIMHGRHHGACVVILSLIWAVPIVWGLVWILCPVIVLVQLGRMYFYR
jgi:hypothetical protein